jgi:two-component system, chemotaxis family, protein-glutamate methylesterase/glutaminase
MEKVNEMKTLNSVKNFPIVCVGGSAGGLDAYIRLLQNLPDDLGVAIVIVNHLRTVATTLHEDACGIDNGKIRCRA